MTDRKKSERGAPFPGARYNYLRRSAPAVCGYYLFRQFALIVLWPYFLLLNGARIRGRRNVRALRRTGLVAVCNHVNAMDSPLASEALGLRRTYYVTLSSNLRIPFVRLLVRGLGGVPLGENPAQLCRLFENMELALRAGKAVMVFPEGQLEPYSPGLRPFRRGAFVLAADTGVPVLPMRITYREPKGLLRRLRRRPFLTLNVLPPLRPDMTLPPRERSLALQRACREAMEACR